MRVDHFALVLAVACVGGCRQPRAAASELVITGREYGFDMPDSVPAGLVHVVLHNAGHDIHEAMLTRFTDTIGTAAAYADSFRAHVEFPANAEDVGGAALTLPADSSGVWLRLEPGRYAVLCFKGDHLERGMVHDLRVVATRAAAADPPPATRQLTLLDFAFHLDTPLTAGRQILHVRNVGTEAHEGDMIRANGTAGLREYLAWLDAGEKGTPPANPVAGFGDIYPGKEVWIELNLAPGHYFIVCGVPAKADGKPHFKRGMFMEFTIQ